MEPFCDPGFLKKGILFFFKKGLVSLTLQYIFQEKQFTFWLAA
jgi:hypothetical protein